MPLAPQAHWRLARASTVRTWKCRARAGLLSRWQTRWPGFARTPRGEHEGDAEGAKRPGGPPRSWQALEQPEALPLEPNGTALEAEPESEREREDGDDIIILDPRKASGIPKRAPALKTKPAKPRAVKTARVPAKRSGVIS